MSIIGFSLSKMYAERKTVGDGEIKIQHSASVTNVEVVDVALASLKQKVLRVTFSFHSIYQPDLAVIEFAGEVLWMDDQKQVESLAEEWKKNKVLPEPVMSQIMFQIVSKCNIQALFLSRELNLPPPIPIMPRMQDSAGASPQVKKGKEAKKA